MFAFITVAGVVDVVVGGVVTVVGGIVTVVGMVTADRAVVGGGATVGNRRQRQIKLT